MSLLDTLKGLIKENAKKYLIHSIPFDHVGNPKYEDRVLRAQKDYCRLVLADMHIKEGKKWFTTRYPVVHALVRFQFGGKTVDIPRVAGSSQIADLEKQDLSQRVALNFPLAPQLSAALARPGRWISLLPILALIPPSSPPTSLSLSAPTAAIGVRKLK